MEQKINNNDKYLNYKDLKIRLKKALKMDFFYEASFIEYAILEDRLGSIVTYCDSRNASIQGIQKKINRLEKICLDGKIISFLDIKEEQISMLRAWTKKRNDLTHNLTNLILDPQEIIEIASEGSRHVDTIVNLSKKAKRRSTKSDSIEITS